VIITDSLSTLTAINGNNHIKNPKTIKLREMMDRNRKQITLLQFNMTNYADIKTSWYNLAVLLITDGEGEEATKATIFFLPSSGQDN
jgi:hypothetical protein